MSDPVSDLKHELLAAAERQHRSRPSPRVVGMTARTGRVSWLRHGSDRARVGTRRHRPLERFARFSRESAGRAHRPPDTSYTKSGRPPRLDGARLHGQPWAERALGRPHAPVPVDACSAAGAQCSKKMSRRR